ncbi:hypothetical protein DMB38_34375 [Streptomyces sp. WAC 06738]|uniref:DUF3710 domain-containing protein n=1 Tax=Streptomyces sp. WAC 06738 TaxID=2203210 RepID=UPI000F6E519D|nr:DUF3710 domain-containing protein [Streptomyces sp. WAC 06738]AZM50198.1 hypothetical protein DMB38_34375 [Streptomyces sp. WAC 06738]
MPEPVAQVKEILRRLEAEGDLRQMSMHGMTPVAWDRITPGLLALIAIHLAVADELGSLPEDGSVRRLLNEVVTHTQGLENLEGADLEGFLLADVVRSSRLEGPGGMTWAEAFRLLGGIIRVRRISSTELDVLLERAEAMCHEVLTSGLLFEPRIRSSEYGPWDISESWRPDVERLDLGSLLVPCMSGTDFLPYRVDGKIVGAIAKMVGMRFIMQAFRVGSSGRTWTSSRKGIAESAKAKGGEAEEARRALGPEVTATLPRLEGQEPQVLRFVGCDGPGWILRGIESGVGVSSDVIDGRIHFLFTNTVVNLKDADCVTGGALVLRWPTDVT